MFRREGVFHEIDSLSARTVVSHKSKDKDKDKDKDSEASAAESTPPTYMPISASLAASIPGYKKLSSMAIDPDDAITLRARVIKFRHLSGDDGKGSDDLFATLSRIVARISEATIQEQDLLPSLAELAGLFATPDSSVSSFELLQSGVVDGLLQFFTDSDRSGECISCLYFRFVECLVKFRSLVDRSCSLRHSMHAGSGLFPMVPPHSSFS